MTRSPPKIRMPDGDQVELRYHNFYHCDRCNLDWEDCWDSTCDDRCPGCNVAHTPYKSEDLMPSQLNGSQRMAMQSDFLRELPNSDRGKQLVIEAIVKEMLTDEQLQQLDEILHRVKDREGWR